MGRFWQQRDPSDPGYQALARGLQDFGFGFASGAGTHGFAAAAPAAAYAVQSAGETYTRETERRRREEEERQQRERRDLENRREDVRWDHYLEGIQGAKSADERKKREAEAKTAAETERRQSMLDEIREAGGDNAARRAALLSPSKLESEYIKVTGAREAKPPAIRELGGDWYLFDPSHPDADDVGYRLYKTEPESGRKSLERSRSDIRWQQSQEDRARSEEGRRRSAAEEAAERELGSWPEWQRTKAQDLQARFPRQEVKLDANLGQLRKEYNQKYEEAVRRHIGGAPPSAPAGNSPRAPAAEPKPQAPAATGATFEELAAQVKQQLKEKGASASAIQLVEVLESTVKEVVPPETANSPQFIQRLQEQIASGKDPRQIASELRTAFLGKR